MKRMKKRLNKRWRAVRKSRANLALLIAGCALLALALAWRFAIAPSIKVVATDFNQLYYYEGNLTTYMNPPGKPVPAGGIPARKAVIIERRVASRPELSTPGISIVEEDIRLLSRETGAQISKVKRVFALDRKTGRLVKDKGSNGDRNGYYIVFPFDTLRAGVPAWSELTGKTNSAQFSRESKLEGLPVYEFVLEYHNEPIARAPENYPSKLTGRELKDMLQMPNLPVGDETVVKPTYLGGAVLDFSVEPRMGTITQVRSAQQTVSLQAGGEGSGFTVTRLVHKLEFSQRKDSTVETVAFAKDEVAKLRLQFLYIPLLLLAMGIACLLVGSFAGVKREVQA
jgi:hypothetical protein